MYKEGELDKLSTCKDYLQVQKEGGRIVRRKQKQYNLDVIISVGYRVKSIHGTRFRQWATSVLKNHLLKGYSINNRIENVSATIYTQRINQQLQLDLDKHNAQYAPINVVQFNKAHDRFLLIDDEVYHIGASIKDLGKKWFAFTLMRDITAKELIGKVAQ